MISLYAERYKGPSFLFFRCIHTNPHLSARWGDDVPFGVKTAKKGKYVKRETRSQPPVEAPYVPQMRKTSAKPSLDKTIDIFEGMTVLELAKCTGASVSSLQDILVNVGEKVESEFVPLSIDIAELVAMVMLLS